MPSSTSSSSEPEQARSESALAADAKDTGRVAIRPAWATLEPVYFDTDRSLLRPDSRDALKGYAKEILDHPEWGEITIDGHCDESGSQEYNLALGERRAAAVKRYLMDLGIAKLRLVTRTFGEDKPAVTGHDEVAWRFNRRSELQVEARESARR